ncbi:MAG: UDPglucose 6-dehydrogenase [archaeon GW2011_AR5]|nr:MAG: UDPglucose 6-dehydrogenase [archaeon GW2011_AR5]
MRITVVGSGYVGLCTAAGFASLEHEVICVDVDKNKVDCINRGEPPIYEEGLGELLAKAVKTGKLSATQNIGTVKDTDFIFIAVGTPSKQDGNIDLKYIEKASEDIGNFIKNNDATVVVKSTVLPGTTENTVIPAIERVSGKTVGKGFGVCVNPEFLREGKALDDFFNPDRIVIGGYDRESCDRLQELYSSFNCPIKRTSIKTAELIKYASNAFLATKITFINEIGNLCKTLDIDVNEVAEGMGLDKRIGGHFLQAGIGFGGSCFGKDVSALLRKTDESGDKSRILETVLSVNAAQPLRIVSLLEKRADIRNRAVAILGLAFKEGTDDVRDAPSIPVVTELLRRGCSVRCYDPKASENMKKIFPNLTYTGSAAEALNAADACLILTGWEEFASLTDKDFSAMNNRIIIEGRKILDPEKVSGYEGVCW